MTHYSYYKISYHQISAEQLLKTIQGLEGESLFMRCDDTTTVGELLKRLEPLVAMDQSKFSLAKGKN